MKELIRKSWILAMAVMLAATVFAGCATGGGSDDDEDAIKWYIDSFVAHLADGTTAHRVFFYNNKVIKGTSGNDNWVEHSMNAHNNVAVSEWNDGTKNLYTYNSSGKLITVEHVDPANANNNQTSRRQYDKSGRVSRIDTTGVGWTSTMKYYYNSRGLLDREEWTGSWGDSGFTNYDYNEHGKLKTDTDEDLNSTSYEYGSDGKLIRSVFKNRDGSYLYIRVFAYNQKGQLATITIKETGSGDITVAVTWKKKSPTAWIPNTFTQKKIIDPRPNPTKDIIEP